MKIGILTHYTVINQGAIMQMYALRSWLEDAGHEVYFLRYTKDFDFAPQEAGKYNVSLKYVPFYWKEYVMKKGVGLSWFNVKKQLMYKRYIKSQFRFANYALDHMDAVIVGSDEVFSLANGCNPMMYGHGVNTDHLISYAPSFGQTDLERIRNFHCEKLIASGLSMFDAISVRDAHSAKIVEELTGERPDIVCDPVMLFDFQNEHADISRFRLEGKKYLLVYSMQRWMIEPSESAAIKAYAEKKGLMTVSAGTYHKWCDRNLVCNPIEWLEVFRGASEVITDTFHGTALSIITRKKAAFYIRELNRNKLTDLIGEMGLSDHICLELTQANIDRIQEKDPDYSKLQEKVIEKRNHSEEYLKEALSLAREGSRSDA